ncbi:MAG: hypothetical protein N2203_02090 [Bacteroidia bacterium]|nr:hypothetical protein [Bacteroidia bacterium]
MLWKELPNLSSSKNYLTELYLNNSLPHAIMLKGEEGAAILPLALGFVQFIYCDNLSKKDFPCGECKSCKQTKNLFYPGFQFVLPKFSASSQKQESNEDDIQLLFYQLFKENIFLSFDDILKEAKGKNKQAFISVQDIHKVIESVSYSAIGGKYNVVCIWHPEMMMPAAANKLLKTLEEPPPQTLFILITHQPEELLPTIISRVQQIHVPLFSDKDIVDYLIDKYSAEPSKAQEISEICNGNLNKAIGILHHFDEYSALLNDFREFARLSIKYDYDGIDQWIKKYETAGREAVKRFLQYVLDVLHHCLLQNYQLNHLIKTTQQEKEFISKFYLYAHSENIPKLYEVFNEAYHHVVRNANLRMLLNTLFLKSNELLKKQNTVSNV